METSSTGSSSGVGGGSSEAQASPIRGVNGGNRIDRNGITTAMNGQNGVPSSSLRSKRELIASMNGTIRRGPGDLELSLNHSERNGGGSGVSWSNQVMGNTASRGIENEKLPQIERNLKRSQLEAVD